MSEEPRYGTWIKPKRILLFWVLSLALALMSSFGLIWTPLYVLGATALPFIYIAIVISAAAWRFGPAGGNYQNRIHQLLIDSTSGSADFVDVGCGNGNLIVKIAKKRQTGRIVGVDSWGVNWQYSLGQCRRNAKAEGVSHVEFLQGDAAKLPFEDASFDGVTSCLTFHEVREVTDKRLLFIEALRILRAGGRFAFFDLFGDEKIFKSVDHVVHAIEEAGGIIETRSSAYDLMALPFPLGTRKVLGYAYLISGTKAQDSRQSQ